MARGDPMQQDLQHPRSHAPSILHQRRFVGVTRDISSTGLFFYANFRPDEGSRLELILTLPIEITHADSLPVTCIGRVVRLEPGGEPGCFGVAVEIEPSQQLSTVL
jgi:hypothetical protein